MAASPSMTALSVGTIAAGGLLVWSAYTGLALFGDKGLLRAFLSGTLENAGKSLGEAGSEGLQAGADAIGASNPATPPPVVPPGYNGLPPGEGVWT